MTTYVPAALRAVVVARAGERWEYCRLPQIASFAPLEIEHIIAEKHGGMTEAHNLALAYSLCNRYKDTDLGSLDPLNGRLVPFFHPRNDRWLAHFRLVEGILLPRSARGRVTERVLRLNTSERVAERLLLMKARFYATRNERKRDVSAD